MIGTGKRGEIHLGDLARALASLHWHTDAEAQAIAACLGFGLRTAAPAPRPPTEIYDRQRYPMRAPGPAQPPPRPLVSVPPAPEQPTALPANRLACQLEPLPERVPAAPKPDWLDDKDALFAEAPEAAVARESLFPERTSRRIVSAALATRRSGREIDVLRLISAICRRAVIATLPRRPDLTLELGCQLLLDYSATTVPFWEDLNGLTGQVTDVVGAANTRVFSFDTRPTEAMRWTPQGEREPWQPDGRPVLVATDLGIQGKSGPAEPDPAWCAFIAGCAQRSSPLVVLIPWPADRWSASIGGYPKLMHWSPHTSAAMVGRKIGAGHRVG